MDDSSLAELRDHLERDLERLEAEITKIDAEERDTLSEASGENNYRDHMADQGSATFERELDMTLEENLRASLSDVRAALQRMSDDVYAVCARCGADIPIERLQAVPTASLCIQCKEAEEIP
jgi:RNA polymerase-binding protein DksA